MSHESISIIQDICSANFISIPSFHRSESGRSTQNDPKTAIPIESGNNGNIDVPRRLISTSALNYPNPSRKKPTGSAGTFLESNATRLKVANINELSHAAIINSMYEITPRMYGIEATRTTLWIVPFSI